MTNTTTIHIRTITPDDTERLQHLRLQLDQETQFMLYEPGERPVQLDIQRLRIEQMLAQANSTILVAEHDERLIGFIEAIGGPFQRTHHCAHIVIGILQRYTGKGIGTQLFIALEAWARRQGLHRLELTVMEQNQAGLALYKKRGFVIEGRLRDSVYVDGKYVDMYSMAKLLIAEDETGFTTTV